MNYKKEIIILMKKMNIRQLRAAYLFIKSMLD